jgi:hypothetical protein
MAQTTRGIPAGLAPVVQRLELDQPEIVTLGALARLAEELGVGTAPALIAHRLKARGWLLETGLSGAWEFAPGAHAGPHSRGGPLLPIKAALALKPDLAVVVALASAAWVHGLADRVPPEIDLAVPPGERIPAGLARQANLLRFDARLAPARRKGVPVQRLETLLVHLVVRPTRVASWGGVFEWLEDVVAEAVEEDLLLELSDRPRAVQVRLAYLLQGLWPALANRLAGETSAKVWFGPRRKLRRHSQRFCIADSILPLDPANLPAIRGSRARDA